MTADIYDKVKYMQHFFNQQNTDNNNNNGNYFSAGVCHMVALMALLHHCVHQTRIKHHTKTILLMLIQQHFRYKKYNIITIHYSSNKNGDIIISVKYSL